MNRLEIRSRFRQENPEITDRVLTDSVLNSWLQEANLNFCCLAFLIRKEDSFVSIVGQSSYDLSSYFTDFYEVDEYPGGGVSYDGTRLELTTKAELDNKRRGWRSNSNGTPKKYYRTGDILSFDRPADDDLTVSVDYYAVPDTFNNDNQEPFNQIISLRPYHYGLVLYLQGRAKMAVGKDKDNVTAMVEYGKYVEWCKKQVRGGRSGVVQYRPADTNTSFATYAR
jgi:inorganic pyrophosphatase